MDHKRLHYILKICMVILLLVLAYFLPRLCAHRMLEQKMQKQVILEIGGGDSSAAFV